MSATIDAGDPSENGGEWHPQCILCGSKNPKSLRLAFDDTEEGGVRALFEPGPEFQGYEGILHGGVIAALLDAAMTHCLFHRGVRAVTADLRVRYLHSIPCRRVLSVEARVTVSRPPLERLEGEIHLVGDGRIMARAEARFIRRPGRFGVSAKF